jgi:hypothetical protein
MIQKVLNCQISVGMGMSELFDIIHPLMKFTIENIRTEPDKNKLHIKGLQTNYITMVMLLTNPL